MRFLTIAAIAAAGILSAGIAAASVKFYDSDAAFQNAVVTEKAVGEFRWGDSGGNATWEIGVGFPTSNPGTFSQANFAWSGPLSFALSYDGANTLTLNYGSSSSITYSGVDLDPFNVLALRARGGNGTTTTISDITFAGETPADFTSPENGVTYLAFHDVDAGMAWTLGGTVEFSGPGRNSAPAFQIKVAYVPIPAALPLLALGLGGLGLYRRRQRKAQAT